MRRHIFLTLLLFGIILPSYGRAETKPPLVLTNHKAPSGFDLGQFFGGVWANTFQDAFIDKVVNSVMDELSANADVSKNMNQKRQQQVSAEIKNYLLKNIFNNGKFDDVQKVRAVAYAENYAATLIILDTMTDNGVADAKAKSEWSSYILGPFNTCMSRSNNLIDATNCMDTTKNDLAFNTGLGIVFEDTISFFKAQAADLPGFNWNNFLYGRVDQYKGCLKPKQLQVDGKTAAPLAAACAIQTIRDATFELGKKKLEVVARAQKVPENQIASSIQESLKKFRNCLDKAADKDGFLNCVNGLTSNGGSSVVSNVVMSDPNVLNNVKSPKERAALAKAAQERFKQCIANNTKPGAVVDSSACISDVTNWTALQVAAITLRDQIPPKLAEVKPALKQTLLNHFKECLDDPKANMDQCTGKMTRAAALEIAAFDIDDAVKANMNADSRKQLVDDFVNTRFASCLGTYPDKPKVDGCEVNLFKGAGNEIANKLFPVEYDKYFATQPGLKELPENRKNFLDALIQQQSQCTEAHVSKQSVANNSAMDNLEDCFTSSINKIAMHIGDIQFDAMAASKFKNDPAGLQKYKDDFEKDLAACLLHGPSHGPDAINLYLKNVYVCADKVAVDQTISIGDHIVGAQVDANLAEDKNNPSEDTAALAAERSRLKEKFSKILEGCLKNAKTNDEKTKCTEDLEKSATLDIALLVADRQAHNLLQGAQVPGGVDKAKKKLESCIAAAPSGDSLEKAIDKCKADFAVAVARAIGAPGLEHLLQEAIGSEELKKSSEKIKDMERAYDHCLDGVASAEDPSQYDAPLNACVDGLKTSGMQLVKEQVKQWMASKDDSAMSRAEKAELSDLIINPCVLALVPSTPAHDPAVQNTNPEGLLKFVSQMLAEFVNYDAALAGPEIKDLEQTLSAYFAAGDDQAKAEVLRNLAERGDLDQLLKAVIKRMAMDLIQKNDTDHNIPDALRAKLLSKENIDAIFDRETLKSLSGQIVDQFLVPFMVKHIPQDKLKPSFDHLQKNIVDKMYNSPRFGQALASGVIDNNVRNLDGASKAFIIVACGNDALNWSKVEKSPKGQEADAFVHDKILGPLFAGKIIEPEKMKLLMKQAQELAKEAIFAWKQYHKQHPES